MLILLSEAFLGLLYSVSPGNIDFACVGKALIRESFDGSGCIAASSVLTLKLFSAAVVALVCLNVWLILT